MPAVRPKPWHSGQAPVGLLKENSLGSGSEYGLGCGCRIRPQSSDHRPRPGESDLSPAALKGESIIPEDR